MNVTDCARALALGVRPAEADIRAPGASGQAFNISQSSIRQDRQMAIFSHNDGAGRYSKAPYAE